MSDQNILPEGIREKLRDFPEYRMGAHKVAVRLADGRVVEDVIVAWAREIVSVDGNTCIPFAAKDVVDVVDRS
jgi:hypothetical protein